MRYTGIPFFCALALSIPSVSAEIGLLNDGKVTLGKKWEAAYESSKNLVAGLSNKEKVDLITGGNCEHVVVYGGLLGQNSGYSITDVLYGDVNPSGRLIHTIAEKDSQYPVKICYTAECNFTEGNYFDYRHFDKYNITPRYEFGYGLPYTTIDYSDIHVEQLQQLNQTHAVGNLSVGCRADLWEDVVRVTANITNSGDLAGHEVPQLYVSYPDAADQPVRLLRGFERVFLKAGESSSVSFDLRRRDLSHWDVVAQEWAVAPGEIQLHRWSFFS
ncbi:beta-glucosidase D [Penicillium odoratum]|uniref:beta-glucosidase D n=1 Tax=Penicillium odoratum TaxID=1167516 RepID=UPI002546F1B2|nr:beta-glucosidase D [Penicillium odoratum]KAJ5759021.1 beta-glucosidase D [Penicillium odoratum]